MGPYQIFHVDAIMHFVLRAGCCTPQQQSAKVRRKESRAGAGTRPGIAAYEASPVSSLRSVTNR